MAAIEFLPYSPLLPHGSCLQMLSPPSGKRRLTPFWEDFRLLEQNLDFIPPSISTSLPVILVLGKGSPIHPGAQARDLEVHVTALSFAHPSRPIHQQILLALIPKHISILRLRPLLPTPFRSRPHGLLRGFSDNPSAFLCTPGKGSFEKQKKQIFALPPSRHPLPSSSFLSSFPSSPSFRPSHWSPVSPNIPGLLLCSLAVPSAGMLFPTGSPVSSFSSIRSQVQYHLLREALHPSPSTLPLLHFVSLFLKHNSSNHFISCATDFL